MSTEMVMNANSIQISEKTRMLIECRAALSDLYNNVDDIVNSDDEVSYENLFDKFESAFQNLDEKLVALLNARIEVVSINKNYKMI
jgi:hypothetical protein